MRAIGSSVAMMVAVAAGGYVVVDRGRSGPAADAAELDRVVTGRTAEVSRRDLQRTIEADGTLGYGERRAVRGTGGTVTALPEAGDVIEADQPLYSVDGHAGPIVLHGELPMWRPLHEGVDDGPDIAQLEANLAYMGFGEGLGEDGTTFDETFTWETREAVEAWQETHGLDATGRIEMGEVWFAAEPVRVAATTVQAGDPATGEILTLTGTERGVHVNLDAQYAHLAREGEPVGVDLADGTTVSGTVIDIADAATVVAGQGDAEPATYLLVEVALEGDVEALDESPVSVAFVADQQAGALAVPIEALVALPDGAFAVEVVRSAGPELVVVEIGRVADGWVAVDGAVAEGDTVVTA